MDEYEVLADIHEVTEWRDGCVWKTRSIGQAWIPMGERGWTVSTTKGTFQYASLSSGQLVNTLPRRKGQERGDNFPTVDTLIH